MFTDNKTINRILWLTYTSFISLLAIITIATYMAEAHFWKAWFLQIIPLLLLLPGLLQKHYRSYSWLSFLMIVYFVSYVVQTYSPTRDIFDWLGLLLSIALFVLSVIASRWLQRYQKQLPLS